MVGGVSTVSRARLIRDPLIRTGRTLRWGILGAGSVARKVVADLHLIPDAQVVGVAARDADNVTGFAAEFDIPVAISGPGAVLELVKREDIDVIYIATPASGHAAQAAAAIVAGKHVLLEKPFTVTAEEAERLVAFARESELFLMEAMWTRFLPTVQHALEIVHSGELGEPRRVSADLGFPVAYRPSDRVWNSETGGGALLEMGPYPFTWAMSVFGEPVSVDARAIFANSGVDAETSAVLRYPGGGYADLVASFLTFGPSEATVVGSQGWLRTARPLHSPESFVVSSVDGSSARHSHVRVGGGYVYELREVTECIQEGLTESPLMPLAESVATMQIFDRVRRTGVRLE